MRLLVLLFVPLMAFGQDVRELLDAARRLEQVHDFCMENPEDPIVVTVKGTEIEIDCRLWHIWWEAEQRKKER